MIFTGLMLLRPATCFWLVSQMSSKNFISKWWINCLCLSLRRAMTTPTTDSTMPIMCNFWPNAQFVITMRLCRRISMRQSLSNFSWNRTTFSSISSKTKKFSCLESEWQVWSSRRTWPTTCQAWIASKIKSSGWASQVKHPMDIWLSSSVLTKKTCTILSKSYSISCFIRQICHRQRETLKQCRSGLICFSTNFSSKGTRKKRQAKLPRSCVTDKRRQLPKNSQVSSTLSWFPNSRCWNKFCQPSNFAPKEPSKMCRIGKSTRRRNKISMFMFDQVKERIKKIQRRLQAKTRTRNTKARFRVSLARLNQL